jgi:hypothetical protein
MDKGIERFGAKDNLGNSVSLYYDRNDGHISKIELKNPVDTSELIQVAYLSWTESDFGKLAKEIEIIQAQKDTFYFNFECVKINEY